MARSRLVKPGFFANEKLAEINPLGRLLFVGLWTIADRKGRLSDRPMWIKGAIFPYEKVNINQLLTALQERQFIERYEVEGERYIQITNFEKHQNPHVKEAASTIPAPGEHSTSTGLALPFPERAGRLLDPVTDPDPVAVNARAADPEAKEPGYDADSFEAIYAKHYAELNPGKFLAPIVRTECNRLEREFGRDTCIEVASDYAWEKHPNYLREVLNDPKRNTRTQREPESEPGPLDGLPAGIRAEIIRSGALKPVVVDLG
jgi:hypothetical protein